MFVCSNLLLGCLEMGFKFLISPINPSLIELNSVLELSWKAKEDVFFWIHMPKFNFFSEMPILKFFSGKLVLNSVPLDFLQIHLTVTLSPLWKLKELHVAYELAWRLHKPHIFGKSSLFVENKQHTSTLHPFWWLSLQIHSLETCLSLKSQEPLLLEIFLIYISNAIPKVPYTLAP